MGMIASCPDDHELQLQDMSTTRSTAQSGGVRSLKRLTTTLRSKRSWRRLGSKSTCAARLLRGAQSRALGTVASRRRGPIGLHGMADQHAHTALALGARDGWNGPFVPRAVQVVSDSGRRALLHRSSVRRAQRPACQPRHLGRAVALVELMAPSQPERSRDTCRLASPPRPELAGVCHSSRDGGGIEGCRLRRSAQVGTPFGETVWQQATAKRLGLESTLRPPGRPKRLRPDR